MRPRVDVTTSGAVTQVVYISKTITLRGGYLSTSDFADPPDGQANRTILDAQGHGRGLYITVTRDIDGDPRPLGGGYDLGADEYVARVVYLPLVLR